ncbi:MAG: sensor histidine kinase [Opitutaceae bacterium]
MLRVSPLIYAFAMTAAVMAAEPKQRPASLNPAVVIESFTAGGQEQLLVLSPEKAFVPSEGAGLFRLYESVQLPVTAQGLDFRIAPSSENARSVTRIQFRLEGWDDDWQEVDGRMWLSLRFLDDKGALISGVSLPRAGQSPGWTGDPNSAPFRLADETVTPPPRSRQMQFMLSSGPPHATGIWLIKGLRVSAISDTNQSKILLETRIDRGDELQQRQGAPRDWRREGSNMGAPQVLTFNTSPRTHALALIDTDVSSSGRWVSFGSNLVDVVPGIPVRVETEEAFSIGGGGAYASSYHRLPAGHYDFRVIPVDEVGAQSGVGVQLPIILVPPYYASWWFWTLVTIIAVGVLTVTVRYVTGKRMQHELERSERRRLVELERMRIAQDIHDDIGARLTQISLISRLALRNTPPEAASHGEMVRVDRIAREVAGALNEIVWAVNPAEDTLEGLGGYISQYVTDFASGTSMRCRLDIPALLPARFVSSRTRHHLLMAVKEALSNSLKHSGGNEMRVSLAIVDSNLIFSVSDDGRGFDLSAHGSGNGLANMRTRLEAIGGTCEVRSVLAAGTTITFTLSLTAIAEQT